MVSIIKIRLLKVKCMSFVNNLNFLTSSDFISKMRKILKIERKIILKWGAGNFVIYDMDKTKIILFSKACHQKLEKQLSET